MKTFLLLLVAIIAAISASPDEEYLSKFDNIDLDALLMNERLLKKHHECLMDRGTCTKELVELKKVIKDALETGCTKCTEKQLEGTKKVLKFVHEKHIDYFNELKSKYDPEGKYIDKYRDAAKKEGITV